MMLYAVIISFTFTGASADVISDQRFQTLAECESVRPEVSDDMIHSLRDTLEGFHLINAHCGLTLELGAQPV
jgi:hypothetical protein